MLFAFANIRDKYANILKHSREHSHTFATHSRRYTAAFAHIRALSHTFAPHSRTFADSRTFAHIRAHSRTFALGPRRFAGDTRTFANRFTKIRAHSRLHPQIRGEIRIHSQRIRGHSHTSTWFTCAYLRMKLVTSAVRGRPRPQWRRPPRHSCMVLALRIRFF